ncbi:fasciclin [Croceivirga lutea]|nr:fasciclin [Croceivirga lutea]
MLTISLSVYSQNNSLNTIPAAIYLTGGSLHNSSGSDSLKHRTFNAALKITQLDDLLKNSGSFTIFAPTENAFSQFSATKLRELFLSDDKKALNYLLSSHIVPGKLTASKILKAMCNGGGKAVFTTIQGNKLTATMSGVDIVLTDSTGNKTRITTADLKQDNTVIHEIDSVMVASRI